MISRFKVGKVGISRINLVMAIDSLNQYILQGKIGYICVTNTRTAYLSNVNDKYCDVQNNSLLTVPDWMPLIWIAHNLGFLEVGRTCGPDLFLAVLEESKIKKYSHYFFGSTPQTITAIKRKLSLEYSSVVIKNAVSPPFQPIEEYDIDALADDINKLRPTFFWCGLGAPKQEQLMAMLQPKLEATICIGVGLVFEYFAGTVERAPLWAQKSGLEGIYRLLQQPKKIIRIIKPFSWIILQYLKSITCRWKSNINHGMKKK